VLVLAIDTATAATAVAVVSFPDGPGARTVAERCHVNPRAHGEQLAPMVVQVLAVAGARPGQLTAIVAGTGPGPFTGLRVGLATAAAMGQALGVPTYGVCSLDGIGIAAGPEETLVATDARRREIYWAVYAGSERLTEPAVDRPADVVPLLAARRVRRALGEGARRYRHVLGLPVAEEPSHPAPTALAVRAYDRIAAGAPGERLAPRYLRRPDVSQPHPPKPVTGR
jgi:tRNA threonylcarbamoyl adenosine modification protein YeaZ